LPDSDNSRLYSVLIAILYSIKLLRE